MPVIVIVVVVAVLMVVVVAVVSGGVAIVFVVVVVAGVGCRRFALLYQSSSELGARINGDFRAKD